MTKKYIIKEITDNSYRASWGWTSNVTHVYLFDSLEDAETDLAINIVDLTKGIYQIEAVYIK